MFMIQRIIRYAKPTPPAPAPKRRREDGSHNPEYTKARRQKAADAGLCSACGSKKPERRPEPGKRQCQDCLDIVARYRSKK